MADEQLKEIQRRMFDAFSNGDYAAIEEIISPSIIEHEPLGPGIPQNRDGIIQWLKGFRQAFPDLHFEMEDISVDGNRVWVRGTVSGTNRGAFMGMPPTNKTFQIQFFDELKYDRNKLVEHWGLTDAVGMIQQLGLTQMMRAQS